MARFSLYPDPEGDGYLLDVQSDIMRHLNTRVVVPLMPLGKAPKPATNLNPLFVIDDIEHTMVTQYLAAVPTSVLKREILNMANRRDDIVNAIDLLLQGS
ncbi:MAG TPA: CcdB family protein [Steroidobacteraceae bacterium]